MSKPKRTPAGLGTDFLANADEVGEALLNGDIAPTDVGVDIDLTETPQTPAEPAVAAPVEAKAPVARKKATSPAKKASKGLRGALLEDFGPSNNTQRVQVRVASTLFKAVKVQARKDRSDQDGIFRAALEAAGEWTVADVSAFYEHHRSELEESTSGARHTVGTRVSPAVAELFEDVHC